MTAPIAQTVVSAAATSPVTITMLWSGGLAIALLLLLSALLSGAARSLAAANRAKLQALSDHGDHRAQIALDLVADRERLKGAVMLGNRVLNILSVGLATMLLTDFWGNGAIVASVLLMTTLIIIFAEVLPKALANQAPEAIALRVAGPLRVFIRLASPAMAALQWIARLLLRVFGYSQTLSDNVFSVQDEIAGALAVGHSSGTVMKEDRDRLLGALDLSDRWVEEIMLHRSEIEMIDGDLPIPDIMDRVLASSHSRLPLYRGERENVIGVIHVKDLLRLASKAMREGGPDALARVQVMDCAMPPYFVPETSVLDEQLREFLERRSHFALVVDEYGSLRGLITLEDILEEIVGEINDEHDHRQEPALTPNSTGVYIVNAAMTIRDINRALDWSLPDEEANTLAGLVIHLAQSIPMPGQVFSFEGLHFEVLSRRENRITRLRIRPASPLALHATEPTTPKASDQSLSVD